jgi:putative peptidoglycan lipid II flippase
MFGVAIGTVALQSAAESAGESDLKTALDGIRETLRRGLRLVAFFSLPTAVAFYILAEPILGVIYQHGAFVVRDTQAAAVALRYYSLGLLFYAAVKVIAPVFYALKQARIPVLATVAAVLASVVCNVTLHPHYGYRALALSTSIGAAVNFGVLLLVFLRRHGGLLPPAMLLGLLRMAVAAAVMGLVLLLLGPLLLGAAMQASGVSQLPLWRSVVGLGLLIGSGAVAYGGLCGLLQVGEVGEVADALCRRLGRKSG